MRQASHGGMAEQFASGYFTSTVIFDCLLLSELRNPMAVDSACPSRTVIALGAGGR
jgi:hypothetical protein